MRYSETSWTDYIDRLSRINQKAGALMRKYLEQHGTGDAEALIRYAHALVTKYGEGSAEMACQMYDAAAEASGVTLPPAEPAQTASREEVARMVNGNRNSPPNLQSGVSRFVKQAAADTTLKNAARDGAEWAWIPHGDTCPFCIMLASNGWQKAGKKTLEGGHAKHIHANCNCEYAVRFDSRTTVAGYDPEKYLAQWQEAGGDLNEMRRVQYARNRVKINAQKRAAYAARVEKLKNDGIIKVTPAKSIGLDNDRYLIEEPKISKYLLKPNAKHSKEFFDVGYTENDAVRLNADIYNHFDENLKTDIRTMDDGTETFSIFMELGTENKRTFRTVWQKDPESEKPRLITAHREDKK